MKMDTAFYFQGIQPTECNFLTHNISLNKLSTHKNLVTIAIVIRSAFVQVILVQCGVPVWYSV